MASRAEIAQSRLQVEKAEARLLLLHKTMADVPVGNKYEDLGKQLALYMELRLLALRQRHETLVKAIAQGRATDFAHASAGQSHSVH